MSFGHQHFTTTTQAAAAYLARGWRVVRVPAGSKGPRDPDWPDRVYQPEDFEPGDNIGIVLGSRSGGLVDVDLDAPEAVRAADYLLPPTGLVSGRPSTPRSHRFYVAPGARAVRFIDPDGGSCLVELRADGAERGDGSFGALQTVVPPSKHPSGEHYVWYEFGEPARVEAADLLRAVQRVAAAALLARRWWERRRHNAALALAGALYRAGWSEEEVSSFVRAVCAATGDPELTNRLEAVQDTYERAVDRAITGFPKLKEILGLSDAAARALWNWLGLSTGPVEADRAGEDQSGRRSAATVLVELAEAAAVELFHDPAGDAWAAVPVGNHREVLPLRSRAFRSWLAEQFYRQAGRPPGSQAVQDALEVLEARAVFGGPCRPVYVRVAGIGGHIYLDLGDARWRVVEVTPGGWRLLSESPVYFWRPPGLLPLPEPVRDGSLAELRPFVNAGEAEFRLVVAWLLGALHPEGPYPVLLLTGEQGTGKSTLARLLRAVVDPCEAGLRRPPRAEHELFIAAANSWVVAFDNVSTLTGWLSDGLCVLATGGAFAARRLYTDRDEVLLRVRRPAVITTIADSLGEPDFRDRALRVELWRLESPVDEATLGRRFEAVRPRILGARLEAVSATLRYWDRAPLDGLPRMADFARWVVAAEEAGALPWPRGAFLSAYGEQRDELAAAVFDDPLATAVVDLAAQGGWRGTAAELLARLESSADRSWPRTPAALAVRLRRLAPELRRAAGVHIEFTRAGRQRQRLILIQQEQKRERPSAPSAPSAGKRPGADSADVRGQGFAALFWPELESEDILELEG